MLMFAPLSFERRPESQEMAQQGGHIWLRISSLPTMEDNWRERKGGKERVVAFTDFTRKGASNRTRRGCAEYK